MADDTREVATSNRDLMTMPFTEAIEAYSPNFQAVLPPDVSLDHFIRMVISAVNTNPNLRYADRRTFFNACVKCASDGVVPDGREAALVVYKTKIKARDGTDALIDAVQYMIMVAGIRIRLRKSGEVKSAIAEVVYRHDHFRFALGDNAMIDHQPAQLDQDPGPVIGSYAIITLHNGEVIREIVRLADIEKARAMSRAKDGPAWKNWYDQMARKVALRRAAKSAPSSSKMVSLERLLDRDDEAPELPAPETVEPLPPRPTRQQFIDDGVTDESAKSYKASEEHEEPEPEEEEDEPEEEEDEPEVAEQPPPFIVIDAHGQEHQVDGALNAAEAFRAAIEEAARARQDLGVSACWENNTAFVYELRERGYANLADELSQFCSEALAHADQVRAPGAYADKPQQAKSPPPPTTPPPPKKAAQRPPQRPAGQAAATPAEAPEVIVAIKPKALGGASRSGWNWPAFVEDVLAQARKYPPSRAAEVRAANRGMIDALHDFSQKMRTVDYSRLMQGLAAIERGSPDGP